MGLATVIAGVGCVLGTTGIAEATAPAGAGAQGAEARYAVSHREDAPEVPRGSTAARAWLADMEHRERLSMRCDVEQRITASGTVVEHRRARAIVEMGRNSHRLEVHVPSIGPGLAPDAEPTALAIEVECGDGPDGVCQVFHDPRGELGRPSRSFYATEGTPTGIPDFADDPFRVDVGCMVGKLLTSWVAPGSAMQEDIEDALRLGEEATAEDLRFVYGDRDSTGVVGLVTTVSFETTAADGSPVTEVRRGYYCFRCADGFWRLERWVSDWRAGESRLERRRVYRDWSDE